MWWVVVLLLLLVSVDIVAFVSDTIVLFILLVVFLHLRDLFGDGVYRWFLS